MVMVLAYKEYVLAKKIGQRVYDRRKQLRLTQEEVAERSGLSQHFVTCLERGIRGLGEESMAALCEGLQVSADYLLFGTVNDKDRNRLVELMQPLSSEQLMDLEEIIRIYVKTCDRAER